MPKAIDYRKFRSKYAANAFLFGLEYSAKYKAKLFPAMRLNGWIVEIYKTNKRKNKQ